MLKVFILSIFGVALYSLTLVTVISDFNNVLTIGQTTSQRALGQYVSLNKEHETVPTAELTTEQASIPNVNSMIIDPAVTSTINLRYDGELLKIDSGMVNRMIGNNTNSIDALAHLQEVGVEGIQDMIELLFIDSGQGVMIEQVNEEGIEREEYPSFGYYQSDYTPDILGAANDVYMNLMGRLASNMGNQDFIPVRSLYTPGTNGEFTNGKYLELDHSSQIIYAWEDGELHRSWYASGFYDEYAVYGVFDLKNKSTNAWSPIAEKWMPYWMAFYYDNKQKAWFGIHELVYWYDEEGNYIEESSDSIGNKKSGGCVRLDRGEMKELYDWAEVGTYFLIHE